MSTITFDKETRVRFYYEVKDGWVYLEREQGGCYVLVKVMPMANWLRLGLPERANLVDFNK
jgi:hypothetical protein